MYSKMGLVLVLAALVVTMFLPISEAQDKEKIGKTSAEAKAAMNLAAAIRMAEVGRETKASEALLAAARVIGKTNVQKVEPKDTKSEGFEAYDSLKEANKLIELALKYSEGEDGVKAVANAVRDDIKEFKRGAEGGPRVINGSVREGSDRRDTFSIRFRGGENSVIIVNNRSNAGDIDLFVQDDNGRIVARDQRRDDDARVSFYVPRTATYQVFVHCYSGPSRPLYYTLMTD